MCLFLRCKQTQTTLNVELLNLKPVAVFGLQTSHTRTQQPHTHKLAEVNCSNSESGWKGNVFKVEVPTLL